MDRRPDTRTDPPLRTQTAEVFRHFARKSAEWLGSSHAFVLAIVTILVWGLLGSRYGSSDTWQLVINTATSVMTFLMVFLIQNTQNRDAKALHLQLDALLRAVKGARTGLVRLENMTEGELDALEREFREIRQRATRRSVSRETRNGQHSNYDAA